LNNSCFEQFAPIAAIATNQQTAQAIASLTQDPNITLWLPSSVEFSADAQHYDNSLREHLTSIWEQHQAFVFCLAAGAVVRLIAPLLQHKAQDPAVVVIDAQGDYVISLCSGHQGKADLLALAIATSIGATPIITGAAHNLSLPAIDTFGYIYGWRKGEGDWTGVMAAIAKQERIEVIQEAGCMLWREHLPTQHSFDFGFTDPQIQAQPQARIWISPTKRKIVPQNNLPVAHWHPKVLWIGLGCERNTSRKLIEQAVDETCQTYHLATDFN